MILISNPVKDFVSDHPTDPILFQKNKIKNSWFSGRPLFLPMQTSRWTGNAVLQNFKFLHSLALLVRPRSFTFWSEVWNKDVLGLRAASYRAPTKDSNYITATRCLSSLAKSVTNNLFNSTNFPSFSQHQRQVLIKIILNALNDVNSYTIKVRRTFNRQRFGMCD